VQSWFRMPRSSGDYGFHRHQRRSHLRRASRIHQRCDSCCGRRRSISGDTRSFASSPPRTPRYLSRQHSTNILELASPPTGLRVRHAVTFGADIRTPRANYGSFVLVRETGHLLGLPDLYEFSPPSLNEKIRRVGGWDIMSFNTPGAGFLAWQRLKLGWLDPGQVRCFPNGAQASENPSAAIGIRRHEGAHREHRTLGRLCGGGSPTHWSRRLPLRQGSLDIPSRRFGRERLWSHTSPSRWERQ
jgi:hypothetical protein